jgi:prepilin-type N-terminal cleavage/methylation domain-containing protein
MSITSSSQPNVSNNKLERAFTLLEVLVSLLIFSVVSSSLSAVFINHLKQNSRGEIRSGAIAVAQQVLDDARSQDPASLPSTGSSSAQTISGGQRNYQVVQHYCLNSAYCPTTNTRHIKVEVSYLGTIIYAVETVYTQLR